MQIYFVRHGESQANLLHEISNRGLSHGLTQKGREQASALVESLQGRSITKIYTSPVLRTLETSVILANRLDVDYEVVDALREYDCGILEGRSDETAWQGWKELYDAWVVHHMWDQRIEGGESFNDIRNRFLPFIEGLMSRYREATTKIVCVSHGGIYSLMLPLVLKNITREHFSQYGIDYTTCIVAEQRPIGLYCIEWNRRIFE